jgi:hypothetical protein
MTATDLTRARRPVSYDTGPCEGGRPPLRTPPDRKRPVSMRRLLCDVPTEEKRHLKRRAAADKISVSELLRGALGQIKVPRRRATPQADPQLVTALSRIGHEPEPDRPCRELRQAAGEMRQIDGLQLLAELIGIERQMSALLATHTRRDADHAD